MHSTTKIVEFVRTIQHWISDNCELFPDLAKIELVTDGTGAQARLLRRYSTCGEWTVATVSNVVPIHMDGGKSGTEMCESMAKALMVDANSLNAIAGGLKWLPNGDHIAKTLLSVQSHIMEASDLLAGGTVVAEGLEPLGTRAADKPTDKPTDNSALADSVMCLTAQCELLENDMNTVAALLRALYGNACLPMLSLNDAEDKAIAEMFDRRAYEYK